MARYAEDNGNIMNKYAEVVIPLPIEGPFTYIIPDEFLERIKLGMQVEVPFRNKNIFGYVVGLTEESRFKSLKKINRLIEEVPIIDSNMLELTKWMSKYYCSSWGEAIEASIPGVVRRSSKPRRQSAAEKIDHLQVSFIEETRDFKLNPEQEEAIETIKKSIEENRANVFLLHGVTASGKTEVYLKAIEIVIAQKKSAIILVPEISITPQTMARFKARFGERVSILHSRLTPRQRFFEWNRISSGTSDIVVGARSAIFSPVQDLGLIVIDEEHETSYKQEEVPRYHVREVAIRRAKLSDAVVVLGSATPSLESFYAAQKGEFRLIELPERIEERLLPDVEIVDMREELTRSGRLTVFSRRLKEEIQKTLSNSEQIMLFLNRRGFSTFISCRKCGYVIKCKKCAVTLTYHFENSLLICHHCSFKTAPPEICPECRSSYIRYWGTGTEKVESEAHRLFPGSRISRLDTDITSKRGSLTKVLSEFKDRKIDILIGTQMIAKGHDFPGVTLVGVISADTALNLPDFRSGERTFDLLTQVAGRSGRGEAKGSVIVQTYTPHHYAIVASKKHDYLGFYNQEILQRKELNLPPFVHLVVINFRARNEKDTIKVAEEYARSIEEKKPKKVILLGPAPAPISRKRGFYHWNIILKSKNIENLSIFLKALLGTTKREGGVIITVDVDPL